MKFTRETLDKIITLFLPIAFIGPGFLNILAYVLDGHRHEMFRLTLVLGVQALAVLLFLIGVFFFWKEMPVFRTPIALTVLIPALLGAVYLWALCIWQDKAFLFQELFVNECYLVSICCALLLIWAGKKQQHFFKISRIYAVILSPVILYYCVRMYLPGAQYTMISLGKINYMSLAYLLLEFCFFLLLHDILYGANEAKWKRKGTRLLFSLFCIAITLTGTKGAIICLVLGVFSTVLYIKKKHVEKSSSLFYPAVMCVSIVLFSTVLFPNFGSESRVVSFLKEVVGIKTAEVANEEIVQATDTIDKILKADENKNPSDKTGYTDQDIIKAATGETGKRALEEGQITQEEYDALVDIGQKLNKTSTGGRKYYWSCAVNEIREAPLTGQGPLFFWSKYGSYPHNFFLEAATDFGIPFMCILFALGLYTFIRLFRRASNNLWLAVFLLYIIMYLPEKMVSGSLYDFSAFFQYGLCVIFAFLPERYFMWMEKRPSKELH